MKTAQAPAENRTPASATGRIAPLAILLLLGLAGMAVVLICTSPYGVGLTADSASYLAAARSLLAGKGFLYSDGRPYTHWPPLFPGLLALLGLTGLDPAIGARWLNAFAFGATIVLSGRLLIKGSGSQVGGLLAALVILLSPTLLTNFIMAWSEPVFILLIVLFLCAMPRFLCAPNGRTLIPVAILAALACLQRYAGVTLILTGAILIGLAPDRTSIRQRLKHVTAFSIISVAPLALWVLRNLHIEGRPAGTHHLYLAPGAELWRTLLLAADIVRVWVFRKAPPAEIRLIGIALIVILVMAAVIILFGRATEDRCHRRATIGTILGFGLTYFAFVIVCVAGLAWDPEERIMIPVYLPLALSLLFAMAVAGQWLGRQLRCRPAGMVVAVGLCLLWLHAAPRDMADMVRRVVRDGPGGYTVPTWRESPLMDWVRTQELPGPVYCNVPDALYLLTGIEAISSPHDDPYVAEFARRMVVTPQTYLVWSDKLYRDYLYDLRELLSRYRMEKVAALPDGRVYRVLSEDGPGVLGVSRLWSPETRRHTYTIDKRRRHRLAASEAWTCEGPVFYVFPDDDQAGTEPVYHLQSTSSDTCFYTLDEAEKNRLLGECPEAWKDKGIAFYTYRDKSQEDTVPVYRFRSHQYAYHFYTADENEKDKLATTFAQDWKYEGVAWYAYGPLHHAAPKPETYPALTGM